jgi:hypothetical protein
MTVIEFFRQLATRWTNDGQCGECWTFSAPLSVETMNNYVVREATECCVHMFVTRYNIRTAETRSPNTGLVNSQTCVHDFDIYFVKQSDLGTMIDNEQIGYGENDGVLGSILDPLAECIGCGREFELCAMGWDFDITQWTMYPVIKNQDHNWTGWRVAGTFSVPVTFPRPIGSD